MVKMKSQRNLVRKINKETEETSHLFPFLNKNQKNILTKKINDIKFLQQTTNKVMDSLKKTSGNDGFPNEGFHSEILCLKKKFMIRGRRITTKKVDHVVKRTSTENQNDNNPSDRPNTSSFYRSVKVAICISCVVIGIIVLAKIWAK